MAKKIQQKYLYLGLAAIAVIVAVFLMFSGGRTGKFYYSAAKTYTVTCLPSQEVCYDGKDNDCDGRKDCADSDCNNFVFPGINKKCEFGKEMTCNDQFDNDYDGIADCNDQDCWVMFYADRDIDSYGNPNSPAAPMCKGTKQNGVSEFPTDCNDNDPFMSPAAPEWCDWKDNNCDGRVDDGFDADGDGYPDKSNANCAGLPANRLDCNDNDPGIHPGIKDICGDGIDQDCDGLDQPCTCTDSDGGIDLGKQGTCVDPYGGIFADRCFNTTILIGEFYCPAADNVNQSCLAKAFIACPAGTNCTAGACT